MRKYEGIFIFESNMEEESRNAILDRFKGIIEGNGSIENVDEWGTRKLAYPINDLTEGYYILVNFEAGNDVMDEINRVARITDKVLRHLVVKKGE